MRKEGNKQSKFKHYILTPIGILKKARELYMKGVADCAGGLGYGAGVGAGSAVQISDYPPETKSVDLNSSRASGDERQRELLRRVPIRNVGNETRLVKPGERTVPIGNVGNERRLVMHRRGQPIVGYKYNRMKMSYCTEVRKMGRIDEDKPCYFEEDQNDSKAHLLYLYPRSRSYVVNRRRPGYYQSMKDDMQGVRIGFLAPEKGDPV